MVPDPKEVRGGVIKTNTECLGGEVDRRENRYEPVGMTTLQGIDHQGEVNRAGLDVEDQELQGSKTVPAPEGLHLG
jgi:hypothetical protein